MIIIIANTIGSTTCEICYFFDSFCTNAGAHCLFMGLDSTLVHYFVHHCRSSRTSIKNRNGREPCALSIISIKCCMPYSSSINCCVLPESAKFLLCTFIKKILFGVALDCVSCNYGKIVGFNMLIFGIGV